MQDLGHFSGYLRSIYWAIVGLSTVGYGDIVPQNVLETIFATIVILFGGLVLPAIVGGLAAYMGNLNQASNIHKKKMYKVRTFMRGARFPQSLMDKVLRYYDYLWSRQGGVDEVEIMSEVRTYTVSFVTRKCPFTDLTLWCSFCACHSSPDPFSSVLPCALTAQPLIR